MLKKEGIDTFLTRANRFQYDYGTGPKALPLVYSAPGDRTDVFTAAVPLLNVPLLGELEHAGDKVRIREVNKILPTGPDEWANVPKSARTDLFKAIADAGLGQGGGKYVDVPPLWAPNFGAENARLSVSAWGAGDGTVTFKVIMYDTGNDQMMLCGDSGTLDNYVRRGANGKFQWDTVRWASAKVNGVNAPHDTVDLALSTVYEIEMTSNNNTGVRNIGDGPSSASDTYLNGSITNLRMETAAGDIRYFAMEHTSDAQPTTTSEPDLELPASDGQYIGFGSRDVWTISPF